MNASTVSRHRIMFVIEYRSPCNGEWYPLLGRGFASCAEFTNHREAIAKLREVRSSSTSWQYRIQPTHKAV
jgi:hypothetical protein